MSDATDPLAAYRDRFVGAATPLVYFDGNSLGRPLTATAARLSRFVEEEWGGRLIRGWDESWMELPTRLGDDLGRVTLGAAAGQTAVGDSTTVWLYKLMRAAVDHAVRTDPGRTEIVIDTDNFPTDRYVVEGVAAAAARTAPMSLALTGGGCFPDVTRARVLFAGLSGGEALGPLARSVRSACAVVGAAPEGGPFVPHVTLARLPRPVDASRWVRVLDSYRGPAWTVEDVTVVASHLPRERGHRPRHEVLARLPLSG